MASTAGNPAVPQIVKALGKGYVMTPAQPSGAYDRLAPKDGRTICWVMPRGSYVRLMFVADVTGAPKPLLKDTVLTKGHIYLRVTEDTVEQARDLIAWAVEKAPAKTPPKAEAKPRTALRRPSRSSRSGRKAPVKKRVHFRLANGEIRTEKINEAEVADFVKSLEGQGATEIRVS